MLDNEPVLQIIQENKHKNLCVSVVLVLSLLTCKSTESTDLVYHNAIYISKKSLKKTELSLTTY